VQHKVSKHKSSTPLHSIEGQKYPETNKKVNKIQIVGVWLANTLPEGKIGPPNLVIEEIRHRPEQQKGLMVMVNQDLFVFFR